jgi:hypothetical protein
VGATLEARAGATLHALKALGMGGMPDGTKEFSLFLQKKEENGGGEFRLK